MRTICETTETHTVQASWQAKSTKRLCGTALKIERAQGHEGVDRAQGQKNNAVRQ